ncbi:MAG: ABC transporter permease subunit [Actinomycetota bacterium]|nr:ABC transporter permease subunit [Actinomycetota bacterium]
MSQRIRRLAPALGLVPFLGYLTVFLLIPTIAVLVGAFSENGSPSLSNIRALGSSTVMHTLWRSILLSGSTAVIGAVLGALLAYAVVTGAPDGMLRRSVTSACGVLAQFGGVTLAFAFIATIGFSGAITNAVRDNFGFDLSGNGWLFALPGLILVYTYFQIPLMVIVFLPTLDGMRVQWREAAESLGATTWQFWRYVAGPLLLPAFLGSMLLLFANAFAAYATAAALVSQGNPILPLFIRSALTSEILLGRENLAYALALDMIVVVAVVMAAYALLLRRTARWLR